MESASALFASVTERLLHSSSSIQSGFIPLPQYVAPGYFDKQPQDNDSTSATYRPSRKHAHTATKSDLKNVNGVLLCGEHTWRSALVGDADSSRVWGSTWIKVDRSIEDDAVGRIVSQSHQLSASFDSIWHSYAVQQANQLLNSEVGTDTHRDGIVEALHHLFPSSFVIRWKVIDGKILRTCETSKDLFLDMPIGHNLASVALERQMPVRAQLSLTGHDLGATHKSLVLQEQWESVLLVPFRSADGVDSVLGIYSPTPFGFSKCEVTIASLYASVISQSDQTERLRALMVASQQRSTLWSLNRAALHDALNYSLHVDNHLRTLKRSLIENGNTEDKCRSIDRLQTLAKTLSSTLMTARDIAWSDSRMSKRANVAKVLEAFEAMISPILSKSSVKLTKRVTGNPTLPCSEFEALTIISNLVLNAVESLSVGESAAKRLVELAVGDSKTEALISVRDNGAGISHSLQANLCSPGISTKGEERGFGLFIVAEIAERHKGTLRWNHVLPIGVEFVVRMPLRKQRANLSQVQSHDKR